MPRKSIYFTDELLPRALAAAELDGRSLSAWTMLAVEAKLAATPAEWCGMPVVVSDEVPPGTLGVMPTVVPDADVLRAAAVLPKSTPKPEEYTSVMAERQRAMEVQRAKARTRKGGS